MKKTTAALALIALLAPSVSYAATSFQILDVQRRVVRPEIVSFDVEHGEEASADWSVRGNSRVELTVRCKSAARLRVEHEDETLSYVQCNGKTQVAYRSGELMSGDESGVTLSVTGDKEVKVFTVLKVYDAARTTKRKAPRDTERATVKVAPEAEAEDEE